MRWFAVSVSAPLLATLLYWSSFVACVSPPHEPTEPLPVRLVATWDPLACSDPQRRVSLDLVDEDDDGEGISGSTECALGGLSLDVPHPAVYRARFYRDDARESPASVAELALEAPIVRWAVRAP